MATVGRIAVGGMAPVAAGWIFLSSVKAKGKTVHPMQLDIYDKPALIQEITIEDPPSELEMKVSSGRKQVLGYWGSLKNVFSRGQLLVNTANVKTSEFMELISSDQTFQIKVAAISTGALIGAIAAGRGRRPIRRIFYSASLGFVGFSICYPNKAWVITHKGYSNTRDLFKRFKTFYDEQKQKHLQEEVQPKTPEVKEQEFVEEPLQPLLIVEPQEKIKPSEETLTETIELGTSSFTSAVDSNDGSSYLSYIPFLGWFFKNKQSPDTQGAEVQTKTPNVENQKERSKGEPIVEIKRVKSEVVGDHGQSNPEDKDMYSTRE